MLYPNLVFRRKVKVGDVVLMSKNRAIKDHPMRCFFISRKQSITIPGLCPLKQGLYSPPPKEGTVNVKPVRYKHCCAGSWRRHLNSLANIPKEHPWSRTLLRLFPNVR